VIRGAGRVKRAAIKNRPEVRRKEIQLERSSQRVKGQHHGEIRAAILMG
jgi:hypothetical protein